MNNDEKGGFMFGITIGTIIGIIISGTFVNMCWREWALHNGYALYNERSGALYFITNDRKVEVSDGT